jgi:hypothetical protein
MRSHIANALSLSPRSSAEIWLALTAVAVGGWVALEIVLGY